MISPQHKLPVRACVTTLFEGHYHQGVACLANSLHAAGYRGVLWAGYRGELPPWAKGAAGEGDVAWYRVAEGFDIAFVRLTTERFLSQYKPYFLEDVIQRLHPGVERLFYFDPDIVVLADWSFFDRWVSYGIAVVEDCCYARFPHNHPLRARWREMLAKRGWPEVRPMTSYYNGGFIGVLREQYPAITRWCEIIDMMVEEGMDPAGFKEGDRTNPFLDSDQDALNMLTMVSDHPLSPIGQEGMGFTPPLYVMSHAASSPKPWNTVYLKQWLTRGLRPSRQHQLFWKFARGPIRFVGPTKRTLRHLDMAAALGVGRFLGRSAE